MRLAVILGGMLLAFAAASAQDGCAAKAHQFDFWIGDWDVYAGDKLAGSNTIEPILGGCALQETWAGSQGSAGTSFNYYNPSTDSWHQFWIWKNGTTLPLLTGKFADGKMTLAGEQVAPDGTTVKNRITWAPNPDGTVRQHWEQSRDDGKTWATVFAGLYKKKAEKGS